MLTGVHPDQIATLGLAEKKGLLDKVQNQLTRERNKGLARHWSYDFNRHLALSYARDCLIAMLDGRGRRKHTACDGQVAPRSKRASRR